MPSEQTTPEKQPLKGPGWPDARGWVSIAMIVMLAWAMWALLFAAIPDNNRDLFIALCSGVIGAAVKDIVSYYVGSSKGAADANERVDAVIAATTESRK